MSNNFFQQNPSKLATLLKFYQEGKLSEKEYKRMRLEALGMNVYTGKIRRIVPIVNKKELTFLK